MSIMLNTLMVGAQTRMCLVGMCIISWMGNGDRMMELEWYMRERKKWQARFKPLTSRNLMG